MNSNAIRAGRAFVELFADDTQLVRGLRAAERKLRAFGASISRIGRQMAGLGAALLTPLAAASKVFAAMGDSVAKMAKRTGFSTEALSALSFAAQQSGTSIEDLEKGVRKMQRTIVDAGMGSKSAAEALGVLGLSYQQLARLSPEEQFKLIAERLSKIKDPTTRAAIAMMIFGRSGTALLPMLEKGAAGIQELMDEAKRLGLVISGEARYVITTLVDKDPVPNAQVTCRIVGETIGTNPQVYLNQFEIQPTGEDGSVIFNSGACINGDEPFVLSFSVVNVVKPEKTYLPQSNTEPLEYKFTCVDNGTFSSPWRNADNVAGKFNPNGTPQTPQTYWVQVGIKNLMYRWKVQYRFKNNPSIIAAESPPKQVTNVLP